VNHLLWRSLPGLLLGLLLVTSAHLASAQTLQNPVVISVEPLVPSVRPGDRSAVLVIMKIPYGFLLGPGDASARNPVGTVIDVEGDPGLVFEAARFPPGRTIGIPVHKGSSIALDGELHIVVPFRVAASAPEGRLRATLFITYTPSLDAGHITTHVREPYRITVDIEDNAPPSPDELPPPRKLPVSPDFAVVEEIKEFSQPMKTLLYRWPEDGAVARTLHWLWIDPPNHGKHVQTLWVPFGTFSEKSGTGLGLSLELVNASREGIMTGFLQLRGYHNEYIGNTVEVKAISCPAAYFNYQFSAEISSDGKNRQFHFRQENLVLGSKDRLGYEGRLDFYHDPRARFHGVGPGTRQEDRSNYNHRENGGVFDFYTLPFDRFRFGVGVKYRDVDLGEGSDPLRKIMPWTVDERGPGGRFENIAGIRGATVAGGRLLAVYDSRNSEFAPSAGFYGKFTAEYDRVVDQVVTTQNPVSGYARFDLDLRGYRSTVDQRFTFVARSALTLTTSQEIPFFDLASFGGGFSDRGFTEGRFYGQHAVFGSVEVRYLLMAFHMLGISMEVETAPFLDLGQVFDDRGLHGRFNVNPGISMRFLNKPNVGIVSNGAFGQDGFILTGGVQLPF